MQYFPVVYVLDSERQLDKQVYHSILGDVFARLHVSLDIVGKIYHIKQHNIHAVCNMVEIYIKQQQHVMNIELPYLLTLQYVMNMDLEQ